MPLGDRYADCRRDLEQALAAFRNQGEPTGILLTWAALIDSCIFGGDTRGMDPWIGLLDTLMQETTEFPSKEIETRVAGAMFTAITTRQPEYPDGAFWAERALMLARKQMDVSVKVSGLLNWLIYHWELGNVAKAALAVDELRTIAHDRHVPRSRR